LKLGPLLYLFIQPVIGWWWFCPIVLFVGWFILNALRSIAKKEIPAIGLRLAFAMLVAVAAIYWWLNLAGTEHRYLYPFLLMLIGWFLPDIFAQIGRWTAPLKSGVAIYCIIPFSVLLGMLHSSHPHLGLQNALGVCLITDCYKEEVKQGKWLMAQSAKLGRPLNMYALNTGEPNGVIEMASLIYGIEHGFGPNQFIVYRANSWTANPGIRMDDFLKSDFVLLGKAHPAPPQGEVREISDWMEEERCFSRFIHSIIGNDHGLEFVSEGELKILRISDRRKLEDAIHEWAQSIQWKNDFNERNRTFLEKPGRMDVSQSQSAAKLCK
jgi:hypothetical protein